MVFNRQSLSNPMSASSGYPLQRGVMPRIQENLNTSGLGSNLLALICGAFIGSVGVFFSPWQALALVIGLWGLLIVLARPIIVCYMLVGAIVLTSGMERGAIVPMLKPNELGFLLGFAVTLLLLLVNRKTQQRGGGYLLFSLVILGIGTLFVPWAAYNLRGVNLGTQDLFTLVAPLQYFLLFWIFATLPRHSEDRHRLVLWMIVGGSIVAVVGVLQAADFPIVDNILDRYYPSSHGSQSEETGRVTSLFGAWNATGIFLMATSLLGWGVLPAVQSSRARFVVLTSMGLSVLGLVATGSFAGMGTLVVGFVLLSVIQGRAGQAIPILIIIAVLVGVLFLVLQPIVGPLIEQRLDYQFSGKGGQDGWIPRTMLFRINVWREFFWPAIRENPVWGTHPTIPEGFGWHAYESQYIYLLFATGLVGFVSWLLWWLGSYVWLAQQIRHMTGIDRFIGTTTLSLFLVMSIAGLTNAVFTFAGSVDYLWILFALTAASAGNDSAGNGSAGNSSAGNSSAGNTSRENSRAGDVRALNGHMRRAL